jgi:hypothetical protein
MIDQVLSLVFSIYENEPYDLTFAHRTIVTYHVRGTSATRSADRARRMSRANRRSSQSTRSDVRAAHPSIAGPHGAIEVRLPGSYELKRAAHGHFDSPGSQIAHGKGSLRGLPSLRAAALNRNRFFGWSLRSIRTAPT